jgi:hypothetical protein
LELDLFGFWEESHLHPATIIPPVPLEEDSEFKSMKSKILASLSDRNEQKPKQPKDVSAKKQPSRSHRVKGVAEATPTRLRKRRSPQLRNQFLRPSVSVADCLMSSGMPAKVALAIL